MNWILVEVCLVFMFFMVLSALAILYVPKIISFLFEPGSGSMKPESPEENSFEGDSKNVRVKTDSKTASDSVKSTREGQSLLSRLNPFSEKKKCNECGTELEYREEYQSYYCPECRTYK